MMVIDRWIYIDRNTPLPVDGLVKKKIIKLGVVGLWVAWDDATRAVHTPDHER